MSKLFGFFLGDLRPDPPKPRGVFSEIPDGAEGDLAKIPAGKTRITCIFFLT